MHSYKAQHRVLAMKNIKGHRDLAKIQHQLAKHMLCEREFLFAIINKLFILTSHFIWRNQDFITSSMQNNCKKIQ
jgi:hypothetical protein